MIVRAKAEIRDPYCGGWVPLDIEVNLTEDGKVPTVIVYSILVKNADGFAVQAKILPRTDV